MSFSLTTADRQELSCQGQLPCHSQIFEDRLIAQKGEQSCDHGDPGRWAIFRGCPFGNMHMHLATFQKRGARSILLDTCCADRSKRFGKILSSHRRLVRSVSSLFFLQALWSLRHTAWLRPAMSMQVPCRRRQGFFHKSDRW